MKKTLLLTALTASLVLTAWTRSEAHCQVPCGIFDDAVRFSLMREDVTTIQKAMVEVERLSKEEHPNHNQITRWVTTKEEHAVKLSGIAADYFLAQRVKPVPADAGEAHEKYLKQLTQLHKIIVTAMKTKQTLDVSHCTELMELISAFETLYTAPAPAKK